MPHDIAASKLGRTGKPIPADIKAAAIADAKLAILDGDTIGQIAARHGIAAKTMWNWLAALGDDYAELRKAWIDNMLSEARELIETADDAIPLARARELWRSATWYAERRDRARYGDQQLVTGAVELRIELVDPTSSARVVEARIVAPGEADTSIFHNGHYAPSSDANTQAPAQPQGAGVVSKTDGGVTKAPSEAGGDRAPESRSSGPGVDRDEQRTALSPQSGPIHVKPSDGSTVVPSGPIAGESGSASGGV